MEEYEFDFDEILKYPTISLQGFVISLCYFLC
jgi:hypothetical protein